jgi:DNA polymerase I-like protein with 3'-5' exonuclease and polymerase domains
MKAQVREKWKSDLISEIHDSLIFDVHPKELKQLVNIVNCIMCNDTRQHFDWINVPLTIEASVAPVDKSWADVEDYKIE